MYDTCIALVIDECPDAVSEESRDGFKVWTCDHILPGLKSDELQRCSDSMVIGSFFPGGKWRRAKRDISWDPRIFDEWKVKADVWHTLKWILAQHPHLLKIEKKLDLGSGHWCEVF